MSALHVLSLLCLVASAVVGVKIANFPARQIRDYRRYDDVTILHYKIPEQIQTATWNFTAWEVKQSFGINSCTPRGMVAVLKHGGFPVVNPDDSKFPDFYYSRDEKLNVLTFLSDKTTNFVDVSNPLPGDWFAIVYNNYTDPDDDEIVQSGLTLVCAVILEASIDVVVVEEMVVLAALQSSHHVLDATTTATKFKFFVPVNTSSVLIELKMSPTEGGVYLTSTAPSTEDTTLGQHCLGDCVLQFTPTEHSWYYLTSSIKSAETPRAEFDIVVKMSMQEEAACNTTATKDFPVCWATVPLTRQTYTGFFAYGFERTPFENGTLHPLLPVSTVKPTMLSFDVNPIQDIGGTLSFEINIVLEGLKTFLDKFQVKVLACLAHEIRQVPQFPDQCLSSTGHVSPSQLFVNTSSEANKTHVRRLHVPFPESGRWFLSLLPFCYPLNDSSIETPCTDIDAVNMTFVVESDSCDPDACGKYGRCLTHMNGGLMFSNCNCRRGYRGWGCTDDSKVTSQYELLVASLLLTLSNLFFFPAIVISIRRGYYTEALVYTFTMFFSTFYHACDAGEDVYSYCIMRSSVLQFCDFYSAVLAVWVTIIAMANLAPWLCSLAHMSGAVIIALGAEYNRTSLWMFLIPTLCGLAILSFTWGIRMRRTRSCYPNKKYWKLYLPIGLVLIIVGLVCFAFLETTRNYKYVHSFWHAIMAISILVVLPIRDMLPLTTVLDIEEERVEIPEEVQYEGNQSPSFKSKWYMFWASLKR